MTYSVEIIDLLSGQAGTLSGSGVDSRVVVVQTDDLRIRDLAIRAEGVATWETSQEANGTWRVYLAPSHGISIVTLRDYVTRFLSQSAVGHT